MHEWFELVHERNLLVRRDQLLQLQLRELELEDRHDRLQMELRERMATSGESGEYHWVNGDGSRWRF